MATPPTGPEGSPAGLAATLDRLFGLRAKGTSVRTELLVDLLALTGGPRNKLLVGVEWYLHYATSNKDLGAPDNLISAPQAMIQWNLH